MLEPRFLIAAPQNVAAKLRDILLTGQIKPDDIVYTGEEAANAAQTGDSLLLTTWRLPDMSGAELAQRVGDEADVLMIVPQDFVEDTAENVMTLRNPVSPEALVQAVRTLEHCHMRLQALRKKTKKLAKMLEERKVIDRAKGKLMDVLHITEAEAHHHIQKKSMDSGRRIVEVAQEILTAQE